MRSVIPVRSCHGYAIHPTQKPTGLLRPLIEYSVPPGGLLVDPFAGSGSSGVAALECGRRAILIDVDRSWCELMVKQLAQRPLAFPVI